MDDDFEYNEQMLDGDNELTDPNYNPDENSESRSLTGNQAAKKPKVSRPKQKSYKKKVERTWTDDEIYRLIKEIEAQPVLWDMGIPEYKLPKDTVWQQVADVISASVNDCKGKWGNLRTTFNTNLSKYRKTKSGQGTDESCPITWKFFKAMMFLEASKVSQSTQSTSSMTLVTILIAHTLFIFQLIFLKLLCTFQASAIEDSSVLDEFDVEIPISPLLQRQKRKAASRPSSRASTISPSPSVISKSSETMQLKEMAVDALRSMSSQPKDKFGALAEYIAAELRSLTPKQAEYAKSKLNRAFSDIVDEAVSKVIIIFFNILI